MTAYGWTLDETMGCTLPQVIRLVGAIMRFPPVNVIAPLILESIGGGEGTEKLANAGIPVETVVSAKTADFFRSLGIEG